MKYLKWIQTDDASCQYRLALSDKKFELIEFMEFPGRDLEFAVYNDLIDLDDYTDEELEDQVASYCDNGLAEMREEYGDEANGVIAECIFEQKQIYDCAFYKLFATEEEAVEFIEKWIKDYSDTKL